MKIKHRVATLMAGVVCLAYPIIIGFGYAFEELPFRAAIGNDHPVRILLTFGFVLAITWIICSYVLPQGASTAQARIWAGAFILIITVLVVLLFGEGYHWKWLTGPKIFSYLQLVMLVIPVTFLTAMVFLGFLSAFGIRDSLSGVPAKTHIDTSDSEAGLHQLGWLISVLVLVLAIFAFGIELDEGSKRPLIRWSEIPAILIVFVLAELGIALVIASREAARQVSSAASLAEKAASSANKAKVGLDESHERTMETVDHLGALAGTIKQLNDKTLKEGISLAKTLDLKQDFWNILVRFGRSWKPQHDVSGNNTGRLLGELFSQFVGSSEATGTVQSTQKAVSCITADSVFAKASEEWLEKLSKETKGGKLVVWAITTLLPTEFAFPSAYRSSGGQVSSDSIVAEALSERIDSLHRFVSAVMRSCSKTETEYKRITVFAPPKRNVFFQLAKPDIPNLPCTLDNWFILDQRLFKLEGKEEAFEAVKNKFYNQLATQNQAMTSAEFQTVFNTGKRDAEIKRSDVFPYRFDSLERSYSFSLGSTEKAKIAILAPSKGQLNSALRTSLRSAGWLSLREWYCDRLHRSDTDVGNGAWWAVLNDESRELLKDFYISWDGFEFKTLDLLLIGTRPNSGMTDWHLGAISNLAFNRTECTIQLVTNQVKLSEIAGAVCQLCNNFAKPEKPEKVRILGLEQFGMWKEWPKPVWENVRAKQQTAPQDAPSSQIAVAGIE